MSSSSMADPAPQIRTSLTDLPRTHLHTWCEQVEAYAASLCREWGPAGALGLASTTKAWNAFPGHELTPADPINGTAATYKPRPNYTQPAQHSASAAAAAVSIYKEEVRRYQAFNKAQALLATAIMESIGEDNTTHLRNHHAPLPIYALAPQVMLDTMCQRHGVLTKSDLELLREPLNLPLTELSKIEKHMSNFRLAAHELQQAGQGLTPFQLFESFLATTSAFPSVPQCMSTFYGHNPTMVNHTIDLLFPFLRSQLPFLMAQSGNPQFSGAATGVATVDNSRKQKKRQKQPKQQKWSSRGAVFGATSTSTNVGAFEGSEMHAAMSAEIDRLHHALAGQDQRPKPPPAALAPAPAPFPVHKQRNNGVGYAGQLYCWQHGYNNTHTSPQCNVMANDSQYTDTMKTATSHHTSGGNPNVGPPVSMTPLAMSPPPLWHTSRLHMPLQRTNSQALTLTHPTTPSQALAVKPAPQSDDENTPASAPHPVGAVRPAWVTPMTTTPFIP